MRYFGLRSVTGPKSSSEFIWLRVNLNLALPSLLQHLNLLACVCTDVSKLNQILPSSVPSSFQIICDKFFHEVCYTDFFPPILFNTNFRLNNTHKMPFKYCFIDFSIASDYDLFWGRTITTYP